MPTRMPSIQLSTVVALCSLLCACASPYELDSANTSSRIEQCRPGDQEVAGAAQCLQDDAACYALSSGRYCTGVRASECPVGSTALEPDTDCPAGKRCFQFSESVTCVAGADG